MPEKARQHYIPQFYLRGFLDPACPEGQEPYLWVYEKGRTTPRKRAPKNVAFESHFYSLENEDGNKDSGVENLLSELESATVPLWNNLHDRRRLIPEEDREVLALFIACMYSRVPALRSIGESIVAGLTTFTQDIAGSYYDNVTDAQRDEIGLSLKEFIEWAGSSMDQFKPDQDAHVK